MKTYTLLAEDMSLAGRIGIGSVMIVVGILVTMAGIHNIRTQKAEESGGRRLVNRAMGNSNSYKGGKAVFVGYVRVISGISFIIFGIVFFFLGPFLAP